MKQRSSKARREIEQHLRETGLPWSIEPGRKHLQIWLNGRLLGVVSRGRSQECTPTGLNNLIASIRRASRGATPA